MKLQVLLLDIEGTTTPISFVYDVLFPYAKANVASFLRDRFDDPLLQSDRLGLAQEEGVNPDVLEQVVDAVLAQMRDDRKTTALKSLQGKIWKAGYADGSLCGEVFDDVADVIRTVHGAGGRVCIYSSGSIAAQKLLFRHSTAGDLTPMLDGYYDTTTGPKKAAPSYLAIARDLEVAPSDVMFCTDNLDEARAADEAGMQVAVLDRPGNPAVEQHPYATWEKLTPAIDLF